MVGIVALVNPRRGMVAILTEEGDYSIVEMLGDDPPEIGDTIAWVEATALGGETIQNRTQGETHDVFFQNHFVSAGQLRQQLLLD